jgi:hypothetical protein
MILKYDVYVSLDCGLCNWKWKYMRIWFITIRHMSFERRLSGCYVGETVNGVVYLFDLLGQLSTEIIIIPY